MSVQPRIAYDVQVIHDCVVRDTDVCRTFETKSKKLSLYREKQKLQRADEPDIDHLLDLRMSIEEFLLLPVQGQFL